MTNKGILKAEQGGFKKRHGTVSYSIIDEFVKFKPQKRRNLLFSCFVDFRNPLIAYQDKSYSKKPEKKELKGVF